MGLDIVLTGTDVIIIGMAITAGVGWVIRELRKMKKLSDADGDKMLSLIEAWSPIVKQKLKETKPGSEIVVDFVAAGVKKGWEDEKDATSVASAVDQGIAASAISAPDMKQG